MATTTDYVVAIIEGKAKNVEQGYVEFAHLRDNDVYNHVTIMQEPGDDGAVCNNETAHLSFIRGVNFELGKRYRVTVEEINDDN